MKEPWKKPFHLIQGTFGISIQHFVQYSGVYRPSDMEGVGVQSQNKNGSAAAIAPGYVDY